MKLCSGGQKVTPRGDSLWGFLSCEYAKKLYKYENRNFSFRILTFGATLLKCELDCGNIWKGNKIKNKTNRYYIVMH